MLRAIGRRVYFGWVVVGAAGLTLFVASGARSAPGVFIHPIEADLGWDRPALALAAALGLLALGLVSPVAGWLTDLGVNAQEAEGAAQDAGSSAAASVKALLAGVAAGIEGLAGIVFFLALTLLSLVFLLMDGPQIRSWAASGSSFGERCGRLERSRRQARLRRSAALAACQRSHHFFAVVGETLNSFAAARRLSPPSIALTTVSRFPNAVMTMMGAPPMRSRNDCIASSPSIPGRRTSSTTASSPPSSAICKPSSAEAATST